MGTVDSGPIVAEAVAATPRRFTVDEYHRMVDAGILHEDEHVELLEGIIVQMSPQKERHARVVERLTELLVTALAGRFRVRPQLPLTFVDSEPEPDLAVIPLSTLAPPDDHPASALLVVEVAASSLSHDRSVKTRVYARAGVPVYWIVDVTGRRVEVHTDPDPATGRYRSTVILKAGDTLTTSSLPGLSIPVNAIFS
jgi:Uma2 family endonuclease